MRAAITRFMRASGDRRRRPHTRQPRTQRRARTTTGMQPLPSARRCQPACRVRGRAARRCSRRAHRTVRGDPEGRRPAHARTRGRDRARPRSSSRARRARRARSSSPAAWRGRRRPAGRSRAVERPARARRRGRDGERRSCGVCCARDRAPVSATRDSTGSARPRPAPHVASAHSGRIAPSRGKRASATRPSASNAAPAIVARRSFERARQTADDDARERQHADDQRAANRRVTPPRNEQQHGEEERADERTEEQADPDVRQERAAGRGPSFVASLDGSPLRNASRPKAATGIWRTKIARQSNTSVSTPPTAGPAATPSPAASVQSVIARRASR